MLIFDQLKKSDPQLRLLAVVVFGGMSVLLAGLWWVQVVSARDYQAKLETQSFRTVRVPAVRGKILDRNGIALADNLPKFSASLYLEELRRAFDDTYKKEARAIKARITAEEKQLGRKLTPAERVQRGLIPPDRTRVRYEVASNIVARLGERLQQPTALDEVKFQKHYVEKLVLPYPVLASLDVTNLARFEEQSVNMEGLDLEMQPLRYYPYRTTAAHLLGQLQRNNDSVEGEDAFFNYPLPVFQGKVGIEGAFDSELRGRAGSKSVLVNNLGYRQSESVWTPAQPGNNVVLTIDLAIQQAAEKALQHGGANTRGAVVVMDPRNGGVLAMASSPTYDPNIFVQGLTGDDMKALTNATLRPQRNRAVQDNYPPGSIFKVIVALAALDAGLNPAELYRVEPNPANPGRGMIRVGGQTFHGPAPPGDYDFRKAFIHSSNPYFITNGIRAGIRNIVRLGQQLHLGERATDIPARQEVSGYFPTLKRVSSGWSDAATANVCIGQAPVLVTPLQMAVMTGAIANGGKVLWPRIVDRIEPQDALLGVAQEYAPPGQVRSELDVKPRSLQLVREAMLADTEDPGGTAYQAFHGPAAGPKTLRVCGKTGTAQIENERGIVTDQITWFISFAPYDQPRYVVVVMVESGGSGGATCAPIAREIYAALERQEQSVGAKNTLAQIQ